MAASDHRAEVDVERMSAALLERSRLVSQEATFVECRCGKHRPIRDALDQRLAEMGLCRACEADIGKAMDMCPEAFQGPWGFVTCGLGWAHTGPCAPYDVVEVDDG